MGKEFLKINGNIKEKLIRVTGNIQLLKEYLKANKDKLSASEIAHLNYRIDVMEEVNKLSENNLKEINPYLETKIHTICLDESNAKDVLADADIICEAFDNAEAKANIVNFVLSEMPNKYIVAASGMAGLDSANLIKTRKVSKRFYLCGDEVSDIKDGIGLVSTRVMLCAAHQAHTVLRIIAEEYEV